ncbi:TOBE domain-containing protein, partial [Treponema socranskii]|uniref:TOBE domain-containing protein n=1 Tax=Treponema socranskii TaxID=53419 RepID=UPI003618EA32
EAMSISDQIIIMNKGKIAQMGTPREIYYQPKDEFVADFIGEVNFLTGSVTSIDSKAIHVDVGGVDITAESFEKVSKGDPCKIVLRPESITLADQGVLPCTVTLSTFMGSYQYYQADVNGMMIKITEYNPKNHKLYEAGDKAYLNFESHNLHIL